MDDRLLRCFIALCTYADQRGVCFPGVRELAAATGFSVELVIELLYQLEDCNMLVYLRRNERDSVTRRQLPNVYMLTSTLYVAREPVEGALFSPEFVNNSTNFSQTLLENERKPDRKLPSSPIHNQNQKIKESKPAVEPAAQPPPQPPTDPVNEGEAGSGSSPKQGKGKGKGKMQSRAEQVQKQPARRTSEAEAPPPTPSREPSDLARYNTPLLPEQERVAEDMRSFAGNMTHANARMLVDVYGPLSARAAVILYTLQPKNSIPNPAGYIRALLRRHAVNSEDVDAPATGAATSKPDEELTY